MTEKRVGAVGTMMGTVVTVAVAALVVAGVVRLIMWMFS